ncbi:MAG: DUF86 domain-containing protein [Chloroflexota bacterium]
MLENSRKALLFVEGVDFESFINDEKTLYAIIRAIEVIGEAAKKVPLEFRETYPQIPWREIAATRDKLIHEYFGINHRVIWNTVKEDLPGLIIELEKILRDFDVK